MPPPAIDCDAPFPTGGSSVTILEDERRCLAGEVEATVDDVTVWDDGTVAIRLANYRVVPIHADCPTPTTDSVTLLVRGVGDDVAANLEDGVELMGLVGFGVVLLESRECADGAVGGCRLYLHVATQSLSDVTRSPTQLQFARGPTDCHSSTEDGWRIRYGVEARAGGRSVVVRPGETRQVPGTTIQVRVFQAEQSGFDSPEPEDPADADTASWVAWDPRE